MADRVTLGPRAVISGDLTYTAPQEATMEEGALVRGEINFERREGRSDVDVAGAAAGFITLLLVAKLLMSIVGAFAIGYLFHRYSRELVATAATQPLLEIGRGAVFLIVVPVASIIVLVTIIGMPLGILGLLIYVASLLFVSLAAPIVAGSIVHKWIWKPAGYEVNWKTILLGVAVHFVLGLIPFLGWLVNFGIMLLTLGAAVRIQWGIAKEWR
ncbi:MAG TPA: hypothetical protein VNM40_02190 [Candidatus Paceibacterota bacterium]|nr:hypothetical protein [Candidatus Paceibacterota bacterium]